MSRGCPSFGSADSESGMGFAAPHDPSADVARLDLGTSLEIALTSGPASIATSTPSHEVTP